MRVAVGSSLPRRPALSKPLLASSVPFRRNTVRLMLRIESEREEDGRWIAEVPALPGVVSYGATEAEAQAKVKALALRVIADRLENGEPLPREIAAMFEAA
jgi:predicted RNase H-like HicB family nuclease